MSLLDPVPLVVEECSCEALEWARLLELVASFAHSSVARAWLLALKPSRDIVWIVAAHRRVGAHDVQPQCLCHRGRRDIKRLDFDRSPMRAGAEDRGRSSVAITATPSGSKVAGDVTTLEDLSVLEKLREDEE